MHILIVTTTNDRSETYCWQQCVARGERVTVAGLPAAPDRTALESEGVSYTPIHIRHRLDLAAVRELRRIIATANPDIIYAPNNGSLSVTLMAAGRRPVIGYRGTIGHLSRWDPASWLTYFHPRLAHIVCVSNAVRRYLLDMRVPADRCSTIYKGHDIRWYDQPVSGSRAELGIPADAFCIGFTGSVRPVKGVDVLIRAMTQLPPTMHLAIVGEVREAHIPQKIIDLGLRDRVSLLGHRRDAVRLTKHFDAFVMPSLEREGLPRAVIEAMAQERPVVVTSVGGLPELVPDPDGGCGIVVAPGRPDLLAEALRFLYTNRDAAIRMGQAGRRRIETNFNVNTTVDQMLELFHRATDGTVPSGNR